jgi:MtrB/PioB family decaheme-associated outer membrane protein
MTMRTKYFSVFAALLLTAAGAWAADDEQGTPVVKGDVAKTEAPATGEFRLPNQIDFGLRGTFFGDNADKARYQRYQDLRDGATVDFFRFAKQTPNLFFNAEANHVGYRDQRFFADFNQYGKVKATFNYDQTPLFFSDTTRTLYTSASPGVLVIDDAVQSGILNKTTTLPAAMANATVFDLRSQRKTADFNLTYSVNKNLDLKVEAKDTHRNGAQPWGGSFGISGAVASELAVPIQHRTDDFSTAAEWSNGRGFGRLAYEGSFFRNDIPSLTFDNPVRNVDISTAPAAGRMALWPNSDMNTVSASGALKFVGRTTATGYISYADMSQNDRLLPFTDNTAIATVPLPRDSAEARARVTSMNYSLTSRPTNMLWFSARYRQYQFDNRTEPFESAAFVNYDSSLTTTGMENEPAGYTRHTFDGDVSVTPFKYIGVRGGYTRQNIDRTFRIVERTTEDTYRASADATGLKWVTVRSVYEHSERTGTPVDPLELLAIGEQPTLRQFDIADRNKDRFSTTVQVTPISILSFNATTAIGKENYPGANFGLRNNDNWVYEAGFDVVPSDAVTFGVSYGYEEYKALQASRTANPLPANTVAYLNDPIQQFNDPRRDWTDNNNDLVRTFNASVDLLKLIPKTEVRVGYDLSKGRTTYVYGLTSDTVVARPVQLPPITNELHRGTADVKYFVSKHLALGMVYWFDKYLVNDFALNPTTDLALPVANPALMLLGYSYRPYTANTAWARVTYLW